MNLRYLPVTVVAAAAFAATGFGSATAHAADTWVLADGRMFEAKVKAVAPPGVITFTLSNGSDQPLEIGKLSERSKKHLAESLGMTLVPVTPPPPVPLAAAPPPAPMVPTPPPAPAPALPPAAGTMALVPRDQGAVDATDTGSLEANMGQTATIIGKVKEVDTMGSTGHKLITFEGTDFNVFVSKRQLDQSADWHLESTVGKTVQVKGKIAKYKEKLQIQAFEPAQIGIVQ